MATTKQQKTTTTKKNGKPTTTSKAKGTKTKAAAVQPAEALQPAPTPEARPATTTAAMPAPRAEKAPLARDPRLPEPGTILEKRDRHGLVRCSATVEESGIRYNGTLYTSISAAALAAMKDLGLTNTTVNGYTFFGLSTPTRRVDPVQALTQAWHRYETTAKNAVVKELTNEQRAGLTTAMHEHAQTIQRLTNDIA